MSEAKIHPTAIVEKGAKIGSDCEIGPGAILGSEVELGLHRGTQGGFAGKGENGR